MIVQDDIFPSLVLLSDVVELLLMFLGQLKDFLLIDSDNVFLLIFLPQSNPPAFFCVLLLQLIYLLFPPLFELLARQVLILRHVCLHFLHLFLVVFFGLLELVVIEVSHGVVFLHPYLIFQLAFLFGVVGLVYEFLGFLLVGHLKRQFLVGHILIELLYLKVQFGLDEGQLSVLLLAVLTGLHGVFQSIIMENILARLSQREKRLCMSVLKGFVNGQLMSDVLEGLQEIIAVIQKKKIKQKVFVTMGQQEVIRHHQRSLKCLCMLKENKQYQDV